MKITVTCPCGKDFGVPQWKINSGGGKYCSRPCLYKFRVRPSGLTYSIQNENSGWIKPGQRLSSATEFKTNEEPWNKGVKTGMRSDARLGYVQLHGWVRLHKGPAKDQVCGCGEQAAHWANLSHEYMRDLDDFEAMCIPCHMKYDKDHKGASVKYKEVSS